MCFNSISHTLLFTFLSLIFSHRWSGSRCRVDGVFVGHVMVGTLRSRHHLPPRVCLLDSQGAWQVWCAFLQPQDEICPQPHGDVLCGCTLEMDRLCHPSIPKSIRCFCYPTTRGSNWLGFLLCASCCAIAWSFIGVCLWWYIQESIQCPHLLGFTTKTRSYTTKIIWLRGGKKKRLWR